MFTEVDYKILELVLQSPEPVPSRQLALVCDVSINTIRTEIDLLNQELAAHGVCIRMKRSSGTSLEVLNEVLARPWMHQMRDMLIRNKRLQRKYSERVYSLTRTILCAPDGITVERLVQVFYVSRGTILADIKNVRALLERFHLSLTNRRGGHGFVVQGSEWHIRQCLLLLHKNYTITADSGKLDLLMQEQAFRAMFFMHSPHSGETAQSGQLFAYHSGARYDELSALLQQELLAQDEFTLPNIHYPKIINMLLLCISRKKYAAEAAFSGEQQTVLQASAEYKFICRLHCRLPEHFRQAVQENEMLMLTALLLCFEDETSACSAPLPGRFVYRRHRNLPNICSGILTSGAASLTRRSTAESHPSSTACRISGSFPLSTTVKPPAASAVWALAPATSAWGLPAFLKKISGLRWNRTMRWKASTS